MDQANNYERVCFELVSINGIANFIFEPRVSSRTDRSPDEFNFRFTGPATVSVVSRVSIEHRKSRSQMLSFESRFPQTISASSDSNHERKRPRNTRSRLCCVLCLHVIATLLFRWSKIYVSIEIYRSRDRRTFALSMLVSASLRIDRAIDLHRRKLGARLSLLVEQYLSLVI